MSPTDPYPMKTANGHDRSATNGTAHPAIPLPQADPAPLPPALSAAPTLSAALHILRRRWALVFFGGLTAALAGFAVVWMLTPGPYPTSAVVLLSARNPRTGNVETEEFLNFQRTQIAAVKSHDVLNRLIVKPEIRELREMQLHQGSELEWLQKDLLVDNLLGPEIMRVTLSGENPEDVEKILNTLITIYKEKFDSDELDKVNRQADRLRANLKEIEKELRQVGQVADGPGRDLKTLELRQMDLQQKITTLQIQIAQVQSQIRRDEADKADFERKKSRPEALVDNYELLREINQNEHIRPLRDLSRQKELDIVRLVRTAAVPTPPAVQAQVDRLKAEKAIIDKEIEFTTSNVIGEIRKVLEERAILRLNDSIADVQKSLALRKKDKEDYERDMLANQALMEDVRLQLYNQRNREERMRDTGMAKEMALRKLADELSTLEAMKSAPSRLEFKERAQVPTARKLDRKLKFAGGAAGAMFGLVLMGVFGWEFNQRRIYSQQDVARGLGMKVVGTLPYQRTRGKATGAQQFAMIESSDALRAALLQAARNDGVRVVMVTSAGIGEGKTSLACQLAASLGRCGRRTLLLDADLRNPATHTQFNVPLTPGFAEVLRGEVAADIAIKETGSAHLSVMPAGECDASAITALAQDEVQTMIYRLKEDYEFVIIDVSPVLPVADALVLGQCADAVLLSVLRDVSMLPQVYETQQRLAALNIRVLGAVVSGERARTYGGRTLEATKLPGFPDSQSPTNNR